MATLLGHRQTKETVTDKPNLLLPRHIPTLPTKKSANVCFSTQGEGERVGSGRWESPRSEARFDLVGMIEFLPGITRERPMAVSVTSKAQVTIPKRVRDALGITPGSKVEFAVAGGGAQLKLVKKHAASRIEQGAAILNYKGPRIPVDQMHGGLAMKKGAKRARR
jgi:antitoxin PrlF